VDGDATLGREQVWEDERWRLSTSVGPGDVTPGFSYLEPKRHIPDITQLDGDEATTLGPVIARCTRALKEATTAELVYVYVFGGGIPHLHLHLAPHVAGDALNDALLKGDFEARPHPSGGTLFISKDYPEIPQSVLRRVAARARELLAAG